MSDHPEHYREIVKALRDGIPYGDIEYKTLNLTIILNHLYLISKDCPQMYDSTKDLLRTLMERHDRETLDAWDKDDKIECSLCFMECESSEHKIDDEIVCNTCWEKEEAELSTPPVKASPSGASE